MIFWFHILIYTQNIRSTSFARIYPSFHLSVVSFIVVYRTICLLIIYMICHSYFISISFYFICYFVRRSQLVQQFINCVSVYTTASYSARSSSVAFFSLSLIHHTQQTCTYIWEKNSLEMKINSKFGLLKNVIRNKIYEENKNKINTVREI